MRVITSSRVLYGIVDHCVFKIYSTDSAKAETCCFKLKKDLVQILLEENIMPTLVSSVEVIMCPFHILTYLQSVNFVTDISELDKYCEDELDFIFRWYMSKSSRNYMSALIEQRLRAEGRIMDISGNPLPVSTEVDYAFPRDKGYTYLAIWEEAIKLGITTTSYPNYHYPRIVPAGTLIRKINEYRNGKEEVRTEIKKYFDTCIENHKLIMEKRLATIEPEKTLFPYREEEKNTIELVEKKGSSDIWEDALRLGITTTSYPGDGFSRIFQRSTLLRKIEEFQEGDEETKAKVRKYFTQLLERHTAILEKDRHSSNGSTTVERKTLYEKTWDKAVVLGLTSESFPGMPMYKLISLSLLNRFVTDYPTASNTKRAEIRDFLEKGISFYYAREAVM
jgi:hypothetical protein